MPNTSAHRLENCFMPPKKSAWRYNKAQLIGPITPRSLSDNVRSHEMGLLSEGDLQSIDHNREYSTMEDMSNKSRSFDDAPLDFSLKTGDCSKSSSGTPNHGENVFGNPGNATKPVNSSDLIPRMYNGNSSPAVSPKEYVPSGLRVIHPLVTSSCRENDSLEMDCSQSSDKCASPTENGLNGFSGMALSKNSPELLGQNSPVGETSILEGMLRGQQQRNIGFPKNMQPFPTGLGLLGGQMMGSPSPPVAIGGSVIHPANTFLPLPVNPYFSYGYVDQHNPFMPYMYKPPESVTGASSGRKTRRKSDLLTDSLKSYSVHELRNKLLSLHGESSFVNGTEYAIGLRPSWSPKSDRGELCSSNSSPEHEQNAINNYDFNGKNSAAINPNRTSEINSAITETNATSIAALNQSEVRGINTTSVDSKENVTQLNSIEASHRSVAELNRSETNGTNIPPCADEGDSRSSAIRERCDGLGKEKHIPDYKKDPNYKMKRAKNNLAARRSRETRRMKEELIRQTATALDAQNKMMSRDLNVMKMACDKATLDFMELRKDHESLKIKYSILVERMNHKRCGQYGAALANGN